MKEAEAQWLASHPEILQKYRGQYIAVSGKRVIAHGKHLRAVLQKARKIDPEPLIDKIPVQDTLIL
jgi:hypothetical protein